MENELPNFEWSENSDKDETLSPLGEISLLILLSIFRLKCRKWTSIFITSYSFSSHQLWNLADDGEQEIEVEMLRLHVI